jgi:rhodanese-related sulfurtransferase
MAELAKRFREIPRVGRVVLYCDCQQNEIIQGYLLLREDGYKNVAVMTEGFKDWLKRKYPVETGPPADLR